MIQFKRLPYIFHQPVVFKVPSNISQDLITHPGIIHFSIIAYYVSPNKTSTPITLCINIEQTVIYQVLNRIINKYEDHPCIPRTQQISRMRKNVEASVFGPISRPFLREWPFVILWRASLSCVDGFVWLSQEINARFSYLLLVVKSDGLNLNFILKK